MTSKATTGPLIILALPFKPKNITIKQSGTPSTAEPIALVHAFFLSLKVE